MFILLQNCHLEQGQKPNQSTTIVAPPPLTPINTIKSSGVQSNVLPKLQRIPRTGDPPFPQETALTNEPLPELPRLTPRPQPLQSVSVNVTEPPALQSSTENKSLVGSVTTWLPHNSKIVDNIQRTGEEPTGVRRPQYLEFIGGRKFLVIPKHSLMSVSPSVAATAASVPTSNSSSVAETMETTSIPTDSASLGPEPNENVKPEPSSPSKPENTQTPEAMEVDSTPSEAVVAPMEVEQKSDKDGNVADEKQE